MRPRSLGWALVATMMLGAISGVRAATITSGSGPGGVDRTNVASDLRLWLVANDISLSDGTSISSWSNRSTFVGAAASASVVNTAPTIEKGVGDLRNGNAVLDFSGDAATNVGDVLGGSITVTADKTFFIVARQQVENSTCCNGGINTNNNPNGLSLQGNRWFTDYNGGGPTGGATVLNQWSFATGTYSSTSPFNQVYTNGGAGIDNSGGVVKGLPGTSYTIGARFANGDNLSRFFEGQIAEVGIFNGVANFVERKLIENYLSSKYDIAMSSGDVYTGDTSGNGNYDYDVTGIGSDGTNSVLSSGTGGFGLEATSLDGGDWLLAGHDNSPTAIISLEDNNNPDTVGERWGREWYIEKTGTLDATIAFDFEEAGLALPTPGSTFTLLYSADSNFSDGWQQLAQTNTITSGTVTFSMLNASLLNGYYTLGLNIGYVPEPSSACLLGLGAILLLSRKRRTGK